MSDETLLKQVAFWPADEMRYLKALSGPNACLIKTIAPIAGAVLGNYLASRQTMEMRLLYAYAGAGVANVLGRMLAGKVNGDDVTTPDAQSQYDSLASGSGPLSGHRLAPIVGFNAMPPLPRYPFGTGAHYSLHQNLDWARARQAGFQAAL